MPHPIGAVYGEEEVRVKRVPEEATGRDSDQLRQVPATMRLMALRRQSALLKAKAVASLRRGVQAFNDQQEDGRQSAVLLHFQHAFEMLLKAGLEQRRQRVFEAKVEKAITFEKCVNLGREHLGLAEADAGTLRMLASLRDAEQHWLVAVSEGMLYLCCRAGTTLFDDLLQRVFGDRLEHHLPHRVLPLSAEPPRDIQVLIDEEYRVVEKLLAPGRHRRVDARARIRGLLAMGGLVHDAIGVSESEVDQVERAVKAGSTRNEAIPQLSQVDAALDGEGINLRVRFVKKEGIPVRLVGPAEDIEAGAVREVDLQKKYWLSKRALARKLELSSERCKALRWHLGIDEDERCRWDFVFGSQTHRQYSDNAFRKMRDAIDQGVEVDEIYKAYRAADYGRSPRPT